MTRTLATILIVLAAASPLAADPNTTQPQLPLDAYEAQDSLELHARCVAWLAQAEEIIAQILPLASENNLPAGRMKQVGQVNSNLNQLIRSGRHLQWMGQPSGIDFERRARYWKLSWDKVIEAYRALPAAQRTIEGIRNKMRQETAKRQGQLKSLEQLVQTQKWQQAEKSWYDQLTEWQAMICFLSPGEQQQILDPFQPAVAAMERAMEAIRRAEGRDALELRRQQVQPDFNQTLAAVDRLLADFEASGTAAVDGQSTDAAGLLRHLAERWKSDHVRLLAARALEWARGDVMQQDSPALPTIYSAGEQFSAEMCQRFERLIAAEARRARSSNDDAVLRQSYAACLQAVAPLLVRTDYAPLETSLRRALAAFTEQSFGLGEDVQSYELATGELLRWRRRVADARAGQLMQEASDLRARLPAAARSQAQVRGLFTEQPSGRQAHLVGTAPEAVRLTANNLLGRPGSLGPVYQLGNSAGTGIARFEQRVYASFPLADLRQALDQAAGQLRTELLVDDQHPPLSLDAARALAAAQLGDVERVGGTVNDLAVEALVTRQATLPAAAWMLVPLGTLPAAHYPGRQVGNGGIDPALEQMQVRFSLQPAWAHTGYAVVELPAP